MNAVERITADARARGETLAQALRHHLLTGLAVRVATVAGDAFVLRGGLATRAWIEGRARRPTKDLDCVGDFPFDVEDTARRFRPALEVGADVVDDGVRFDPARFAARGIWLDSAFPGVRITVTAGVNAVDQELTVDVGFHDPLVPPATTLVLGGTAVRAVRPETQVAWKLHGLAEMTASWRPKDLADLWLITRHVALVEDDLVPAIDAAFASRGFTREQARRTLAEPMWATKTARLRWEPYRTTLPELAQVVAEVRAHLDPALARLMKEP
ncbi:MAG: nucleotidyl transferase AbiEii/AbiGii toxin family protein [Deltaproteobacteria bacterium]|nr:nucleotidyl transferase AbiEii/AbiGii toxin family protein [Deltaproteobacteria bacterium]